MKAPTLEQICNIIHVIPDEGFHQYVVDIWGQHNITDSWDDAYILELWEEWKENTQ